MKQKHIHGQNKLHGFFWILIQVQHGIVHWWVKLTMTEKRLLLITYRNASKYVLVNLACKLFILSLTHLTHFTEQFGSISTSFGKKYLRITSMIDGWTSENVIQKRIWSWSIRCRGCQKYVTFLWKFVIGLFCKSSLSLTFFFLAACQC